MCDRFPVCAPSAQGGQCLLTIIQPASVIQKLGVAGVKGGRHKAALAIDAAQNALSAEAIRFEPDIIIGQEEQMMRQFVRQRPPPLFAQIARFLAKGVPRGTHADLTRDIGRRYTLSCLLVRVCEYNLAHRALDDTANRG